MINNYNTRGVLRRARRFLVLAAALVAVQSVRASAITLYAIGADSFGAPTGLNSMDPSSSSTVTNLRTPLGD